MSPLGSNLPEFMARQLEFAAHIRNPEVHPAPADIEPRRMQIYLDLFYNNIESFLSGGFPVARKVLSDARWHALVRQFVHRHPSESPYFLEISQEFLTFLHDAPPDGLPPFYLELCHYEWVELALSVSEEELPADGIDRDGDILKRPVAVSPLIWKLSYRFPVHKIGPDFLPEAPGPDLTHLVVNRRRDDSVGFLEANALTLRLLELLETADSGALALAALSEELPRLDGKIVCEKGVETLTRLRKAEIILGAKTVLEP
jgi:hypothetical protein